MTRRRLTSLFRSEKSLPADVSAALQQLAVLAEQRPSLQQPSAVLEEILRTTFQCAPPPAVTLTPSEAQQELSSHAPLLRDEIRSLDAPRFNARWQNICRALWRHQDSHLARDLMGLWQRAGWKIEQVLAQVANGDVDALRGQMRGSGLDVELTTTVLRLTLFPTLSQLAARIAPLQSATTWQRGSCPACGSWPLLAEFRGLEQLRYLRCGLCGSEWQFPRLACPYCGTRDHRRLGHFHVEGEEAKYRVTTCDACHGYLKTASTLTALSAPQLLVTDLATLHLDLAAAARGCLCHPAAD